MIRYDITFIALVNLILNSKATLLIDTTQIQIVDKFGDDVSLLYYDSAIRLVCVCYTCQSKDSIALVDPKGNTVDAAVINDSTKTVSLTIVINKNVTLGAYKCRVNGIDSSNDFNVSYRLCADGFGDICNFNCCRQDGFDYCIVAENFQNCTCYQLDKNLCISVHHPTITDADDYSCQIQQSQFQLNRTFATFPYSTCLAAAMKFEVHYTTTVEDSCNEASLVYTLKDKPLAIGRYVDTNLDLHNLRLECSPKSDDSNVTCRQVDAESKMTIWQKEATCEQFAAKNNFAAILQNSPISRSHVSKLSCKMATNFFTLKTYIFLVKTDPTIHVDPSWRSTCHQGHYVENLKCAFRSAHSRLFFSVNLTWLKDGAILQSSNDLSLVIPVKASGVYVCIGTVTYKSCSPYKEFVDVHKLNYNLSSSCVKEEPNQPTALWHVILGCGIFLVLVVALVVVLFFVHKSKTNAQQKIIENYKNAELIELSEVKFKEHNQKYEDLLGTTLGLVADDGNAKAFLMLNIGTTDDDTTIEKHHKTVSVPTCKDPTIPCLTKNQILVKQGQIYVGTHMNKILDFRNQPMFLCQAPQSSEFATYWRAIIKEKIGVIVWLGEFDETEEEKFKPYVPYKFQAEQIHKQFKIKNVMTSIYKDHAIYIVDVCNIHEFGGERRARRLACVHGLWPDEDALGDPQRLCRLVATVQHYHDILRRTKRLSGVLVHYTSGIRRSSAFACVYIARQMLLEYGIVNLVAVANYVRKYRHGTFTKTADGHKQLQIVYVVMEAFAKMNGAEKSDKSRMLAFDQNLLKEHQNSTNLIDGKATKETVSKRGSGVDKSVQTFSLKLAINDETEKKKAKSAKETVSQRSGKSTSKTLKTAKSVKSVAKK